MQGPGFNPQHKKDYPVKTMTSSFSRNATLGKILKLTAYLFSHFVKMGMTLITLFLINIFWKISYLLNKSVLTN
jgi:hypothetical protein